MLCKVVYALKYYRNEYNDQRTEYKRTNEIDLYVVAVYCCPDCNADHGNRCYDVEYFERIFELHKNIFHE